MKSKPDILPVIEGAGVELRKRGRDFWGRCPFHEEKTPSFSVSPEKQRFHCFGCGEGGDVIAFIQKRNGVNFQDALGILGIRKGHKPKPDRKAEDRRRRIDTFNTWVKDRYERLCVESIELHDLRMAVQKRLPQDERIAWMLAEAMGRLPAIDHELDVLLSGDRNEIFEYFAEYQRTRQ